MNTKTIVFIDGDDTLWDTQSLYDHAITAACEKIKGEGFDVTHWHEAVDNAEKGPLRKLGFAKERFASALVEAYISLCRQQSKNPNNELSNSIKEFGMQVFENKAALFEGTWETVKIISLFAPVYLVSAGPEDIQNKRMLESGLEQFLAGYFFPFEKNAEVFNNLIGDLNIDPAKSWHVGNSIRSDINPSRKAGLNAILVGSRGWAYDKEDILDAKTRLEVVPHLRDVFIVLQKYYGWKE